ncbi:Hypothetical predicted protein [Mytilus galloprovincialis]|uniref:Endonuclease/exonuclease/phosphatase domain-containing protein n=1 Tax=Mytilus galloprovincialis TaxID=29158 RepID=A0A8B6BL59_MYTGA|nr:Hypothetical predicted protein [Mytilus galloprovincialis]
MQYPIPQGPAYMARLPTYPHQYRPMSTNWPGQPQHTPAYLPNMQRPIFPSHGLPPHPSNIPPPSYFHHQTTVNNQHNRQPAQQTFTGANLHFRHDNKNNQTVNTDINSTTGPQATNLVNQPHKSVTTTPPTENAISNMATTPTMLNSTDTSELLNTEHWLFKFEQDNIGELFNKTSWTCKSVDENNPIPPTQKPRGYGGVAILWKQHLDHLVEKINDGSERIICIKINVKPKPILLICAYMPCRGSKQANEQFKECLDQLHEIILKYSDTCTPVLCGDWNCDLMKTTNKSARIKELEDFISSKKLMFKPTPLTFIHPNGNETSTIDYIFVHDSLAEKVYNTIRLDMLSNNTSDHYPLLTEIETEIVSKKKQDHPVVSNKIKWDKIDLQQYQDSLKKCLQENPIDYLNDSTAITRLMETIVTAQKNIVPSSKISTQRNRHIWNDEIEQSLKMNKSSLDKWKLEGKPTAGETMQERKKTKKQLRKARRQEIARQRDESLQKIMNATQRDSKIFHRLVNAQRKTKKSSISDLTVEDKTYSSREEILQGWNEHFSKLATPESNTTNSDHTNKEFDIDIIEEICKQNAVPLTFTAEEIDKAINQLNTNKAPDIYGITAEHIKYGGDTLLQAITSIINNICSSATIPDCIKHGILTPIFKNKGLPNEAKNYRGITVLPNYWKNPGNTTEEIAKRHH